MAIKSLIYEWTSFFHSKFSREKLCHKKSRKPLASLVLIEPLPQASSITLHLDCRWTCSLIVRCSHLMLHVFFFQNLQETTEFDQAVSRPNVRLLLQSVAFFCRLAHLLAWTFLYFGFYSIHQILASTTQNFSSISILVLINQQPNCYFQDQNSSMKFTIN